MLDGTKRPQQLFDYLIAGEDMYVHVYLSIIYPDAKATAFMYGPLKAMDAFPLIYQFYSVRISGINSVIWKFFTFLVMMISVLLTSRYST